MCEAMNEPAPPQQEPQQWQFVWKQSLAWQTHPRVAEWFRTECLSSLTKQDLPQPLTDLRDQKLGEKTITGPSFPTPLAV